jgi:O-antigen/teichoic acid export membrane protein
VKTKSAKTVLSFNWQHDIRPFMEFMSVGHLSNVINFLNYRLVLWIIAIYLDNYRLGLFALASGLTQLLGFLSTPLSQVLMPYLSSYEETDRNRLFIAFSRMHFAVLLALSVFAAGVAHLFVPKLYGNEFKESILPFIILLIGSVFAGQTRIIATMLIADYKLIYNLYSTIVGFVLTLSTNFFFVKWYGIIGAAWAQSITYSGIFLSVHIAIVTVTSISTKNLLLPTKDDVNNAWNRFRRKSQKTI